MFENKKKIIGVIGAMQSEIDALKEKITDAKVLTVSGIDYVYGEMYGVNVVAAVSGVGKVFAAICTQTMILTFHPEIVINIGVGGSLTDKLDISDLAIANQVVQHDMDTSAVGDPIGLISGINKVYLPCSEKEVALLEECAKELHISFCVGTIASGDCFVKTTQKRTEIVNNFGAIVAEMEGASIGHVCYVNNVDCCVIRAISDNGDENSHMDYYESLGMATKVSLAMIDLYLQKCADRC
jgi:adenosylhomocysteine nucleosidase